MNRLARDATAVNVKLRAGVRGRPVRLYDAAYHLIKSGGKRLRPHLVMTCSEMLGGTRQDAIHAAAALEMVHNFTLVHDDIMDNDPIRHGVKTVHKKFGQSVAILAGDVLFSKAYVEVLRSPIGDPSKTKLVQTLAKACVDICEGQIMDVDMAARKGCPTRLEYITMINKKTAALFEAACVMGAVTAGATKRDIANVAKFGQSMGIAFQITDDIIGAMGDSKLSKKPVGNDLREGKKSLPILLALQKARGAQVQVIRSCFGNPRATQASLLRAVNAMKKSGAEDAARAEASKYATRAQKALGSYTGPAAKDMILLLQTVVNRSM